ncbi:MAG: UvrD-helicase domain-containing protein, partial [Oscillospiraceae bacterium]|nr:UvrD-helicase domain-containing protein [Oscillospiraceae bacterium]
MNILDNLNNEQIKAVKHSEGPVLVLAGAGSGKTTVLVSRIAYLIYEKNVRPYNILAITFTNKAAREMKERVVKMAGEAAAEIWMGTFHSVCVRILRGCIETQGYDSNFVIYDTSDSVSVMKECMKELNINDKNFPVKSVLSIISRAKDDMLSPERFEEIHREDFRMSTVAGLYKLYQKKLMTGNALDFDDIIYVTVKIFSENPDILEKYQNRFKYIMVDEYQDTNNVQYKLISMLAAKSRNLCAVGDDDQSIYKFRGANIRNILDFEREFQDAEIIKLEQNYRSTQNILDAANSVISNNTGRKGKELWTDNGRGGLINYFTASNEYNEGEYIAKSINKLVRDDFKYGDCAVLYRTNVQSRVLEEMMLRNAVPYRILAGLRFYDRKEIKDITAYLKVLYNPHDDIGLRRIINEPKRGIGDTTVEKAAKLAAAAGTSLFDVFAAADDIPELSRAAAKINLFMDIIRNLMMAAMSLSVPELVMRVMEDTGYLTMLKNENTVESRNRTENLQEFMTVAEEHARNTENADLGTFLESISLISDIDSYDEEQDAVVLMTVHSAKGLEFPNVFLAGMEEGIFPGIRSMD